MIMKEGVRSLAKKEKAKNKGAIVQVIGPVVDVQFAPGNLPAIKNAINIKDEQKNISLVVEVAQHLGNDTARCVAMSSTDGLVRGMEVIDTGAPITVPGWENGFDYGTYSKYCYGTRWLFSLCRCG